LGIFLKTSLCEAIYRNNCKSYCPCKIALLAAFAIAATRLLIQVCPRRGEKAASTTLANPAKIIDFTRASSFAIASSD